MSLIFSIVAYVGCGICLVKTYVVGKRILALQPKSDDTDPFAGSTSRIFSMSEDPSIRAEQRSLIRWMAGAILLLTIARFIHVATMNVNA